MHIKPEVDLREIDPLELFSMAYRSIVSMAAVALIFMVFIAIPSRAQPIGVVYGTQGNNLPPPNEVVGLYKSKNIQAMRLYGPNEAVLQALKRSNIQLMLDVPNADLQLLASNPSAANDWVQRNVKAYSPAVSFKYIAVGNQVIPGDQAQYVLPAMKNIHSALSSVGLQNQIKVSTAIATGREVLEQYSPPSSCRLSSDASTYLGPIVQFLASTGAPLLVNLYTYRNYVGDPNHIGTDYALFTSPGTVIQDGQYNYQHLFDTVVDALYVALEKLGGSNVMIVVSESGWPSAGGLGASVDNARTYNQNLINHVGQGTPRRPGRAIEAYIFEMFNENQKPQGSEQNFGLFYTDGQPVFPINFP